MTLKKMRPIVFSLLLILGAAILVLMLEPEPEGTIVRDKVRQPVSVIKVRAKEFQPRIKLVGISCARWPVKIKSPASSKLSWLAPNIEPGRLVKKGEVLAKIDTTHLKSQLANAYSALKQAELNLNKEKHEQTVALKMLSQRNSSAYARREPQIDSATAELQRAKEAYASAKAHLNDARIVAPFDAIITRRAVSPAQYVDAGDVLFELASSESLDVHVPVPEHQWSLVSGVLENPEIWVTDQQKRTYKASVRYITPLADIATRQREVVLSVANPYVSAPKLLPNQQLTAHVGLPYNSFAMRVPLSALSRDGQIWTVSSDNQLHIENVSVLEETENEAYVVFNEQPDKERNVVVYPLLSMIPGTIVSPEQTVPGSTYAGVMK